MRTCQAGGEPFFAYIATNAPHGPLYVPDRYRAPFTATCPETLPASSG